MIHTLVHNKFIGKSNKASNNKFVIARFLAILIMSTVLAILVPLLLGTVTIMKFIYDIDTDVYKYISMSKILLFTTFDSFLNTLTTSLMCGTIQCKINCN